MVQNIGAVTACGGPRCVANCSACGLMWNYDAVCVKETTTTSDVGIITTTTIVVTAGTIHVYRPPSSHRRLPSRGEEILVEIDADTTILLVDETNPRHVLPQAYQEPILQAKIMSTTTNLTFG